MTLDEAKKETTGSIEASRQLIAKDERHFDGKDSYREMVTDLFAAIKRGIVDKIDGDADPVEKATWEGYLGGLKLALRTLDDVDAKPVKNPNILTLEELARELRKLFRFKYLTCDDYDQQIDFCIWQDKPYFEDHEWKTDPPYAMSLLIEPDLLIASVDLSEYAGESGVIDYSKCIVEVANDTD